MTIEEIKELLAVFNESGVAELEVQRGENRVRIRRSSGIQDLVMPPAAPIPYPLPPAMPVPPSASPSVMPVPPATPAPKSIEADDHLVKSPIVGTYYDAAKPGDPPFVRVGDAVEIGQVLCIIESMKLMNEIEAEAAGTVTGKLVENGRPVEYGEALFSIRPR
ncbi:MAG: acetyl-CoA carboxylase biotin carboxyl carrier protein [Bryobacteraceae bacterium]